MKRISINVWLLVLAMLASLLIEGCGQQTATVNSTIETRNLPQKKGVKKQGLTAENPG